jgi:hypothetical protein
MESMGQKIETEIWADMSFDITKMNDFYVVAIDKNLTNLQSSVNAYFTYSLKKRGYIENKKNPKIIVFIRSMKSVDKIYIPAHTVEVPYNVMGTYFTYSGEIGFAKFSGTKDKYVPEAIQQNSIYVVEITIIDVDSNKQVLRENAVYIKVFNNYEDDLFQFMEIIDSVISEKPFTWNN